MGDMEVEKSEVKNKTVGEYMKLGIICTMINGFGRRGYYNTQEIGLGRELERQGHEVTIYKCVKKTGGESIERVKLGNTLSILYIPVSSFGAHGCLDTAVLSTNLDAVLCFADNQIFLPHIYRFCARHEIRMVPYIGRTHSSSGGVHGFAMNTLFHLGTLRWFRRGPAISKIEEVRQELLQLGVKDVKVAPVGLDFSVMKSDFAAYDRAALRREFGLLPEDMVICTVGRMGPEKNPLDLVEIYQQVREQMLGAMSTKAQLGFYEAAEKIILCASSVITAFGTVMMPRMTKLFSDGNVSESQRYMKLSVEAVMASSFAISLGILSVSRLFAPIFWGKDFASCAYILSALALSIPFSGFANVIRMQYLIPNGMDRAYIISVILGAVSNLIANSLLISIYGALGAALGTVIAEGIVCIAQCFAVRKRISLQKYLNCIVPFGVAGLIMAAAVRVIDHVAIVTIPWLLIEIFVGSIVYCSLSLLYLYYTRNELLMAGIQKFSKR